MSISSPGRFKTETENEVEDRMAGQPKLTLSGALAVLLVLTAWMASSPPAVADQAQARSLLKAMTDYVGAQQSIAFDYDATLEVVTKDRQKLQLASSGTVSLARPDKIHTTRSGGFVDIETVFDGKTLTLFGKGKNVYTQVEVPGSLDNLVNELQRKYDRPLPAADLFLTHAYDEITAGVTDVKDLGSGVIGGIECDYFAFRAKDVDWQIWVTQGAKPRPCRYVITSTGIADGPHTPSNSELEDRQRGRHAGLRVQATVRCEAGQHRRAQEAQGHGRATESFHPRRQVMTTRTLRALLLLVIVTWGATELVDRIPVLGGLATSVKAEVGRPLTPVSVSGVARRTARRN